MQETCRVLCLLACLWAYGRESRHNANPLENSRLTTGEYNETVERRRMVLLVDFWIGSSARAVSAELLVYPPAAGHEEPAGSARAEPAAPLRRLCGGGCRKSSPDVANPLGPSDPFLRVPRCSCTLPQRGTRSWPEVLAPNRPRPSDVPAAGVIGYANLCFECVALKRYSARLHAAIRSSSGTHLHTVPWARRSLCQGPYHSPAANRLGR